MLRCAAAEQDAPAGMALARGGQHGFRALAANHQGPDCSGNLATKCSGEAAVAIYLPFDTGREIRTHPSGIQIHSYRSLQQVDRDDEKITPLDRQNGAVSPRSGPRSIRTRLPGRRKGQGLTSSPELTTERTESISCDSIAMAFRPAPTKPITPGVVVIAKGRAGSHCEKM